MKSGLKSTIKAVLSSKRKRRRGFFDRLSDKVARGAGKPLTSVIAFALVLLWGLSGPFFGYSQTWQLIINTATTVITFLMVFLIQQSQNRDNMAVQLKLNELIACHKRASNRLIDIEDLSAEELDVVRKFYVKLSALAEAHNDLHSSHSIDEAEKVHMSKGSRARKAKRSKTTEKAQ
jgi:low affinity Fe/Cu permease